MEFCLLTQSGYDDSGQGNPRLCSWWHKHSLTFNLEIRIYIIQYSIFKTVLILLSQRRTALFDKGFAALLGLAAAVLAPNALAAPPTSTEERVLGIFEKRCAECHNGDKDGEDPPLSAKIDPQSLRGNPDYVSVAAPDKSELLRRLLLPSNSPKRMPKSKGQLGDKEYREPLSQGEIETILSWIRGRGTVALTADNDPSSTSTPHESDHATSLAQPSSTPAASSTATPSSEASEIPTRSTLPAVDASVTEQVKDLFQRRCSECHTQREPFLNGEINLTSLRTTSKFVVPGDPKSSPIYVAVIRPRDDPDRMPQSAGKPVDKKYRAPLGQEEQDLIDHWIVGDGEKATPREFISLEAVLKFVLDDLESQPESRRPFLRYLTLANLYNIKRTDGKPTESDASMETYRAAVTKLVNCLSTSARIIAPAAIDPARTLFRLDLRDYEMAPETWEGIVGFYPYGIVGASTRLENRIQAMTHSRQACLRGDWFLFAASQPPLYHDILHLPAKEQELESKFGLDTLADLRAFRAIRAAFFPSGISFTNRLIERHEIGSYSGAYWKSYDFKRDHSGERQDLSLAPLGPIEAGLTQDPKLAFKHDGGEIIFQLPNGLIGGYLAKADGTRLNRAPVEIVQDKTHTARDDSGVINGISCIVCHSDGFKAPPGQSLTTIADQLGRRSADLGTFAERNAIERLYPEPSVLQAQMKTDVDRFRDALKQATPGYIGEEPVHVLYQRFLQDIVGEQFGTEFWTDEKTLLDTLDQSSDPALHVLASKMKNGLPFAREAFLRTFERASHELGFQLLSYIPVAYEEFGGAATGVTQAPANEVPGQPDRTVVHVPGSGTLTMEMSKLAYRIGESLRFTLTADTDCFVKIVQFGADHSTTQLVPNGLNNVNQMRAAERRVFPGRTTDGANALSFTTTPPSGAETLLVLVSRSQFRDDRTTSPPQQPFRGYARGSIIGTRGLILIQAGAPDAAPTESAVAEGQVGYQLVQ
jgi:mono/diheme cytochrome c family protein